MISLEQLSSTLIHQNLLNLPFRNQRICSQFLKISIISNSIFLKKIFRMNQAFVSNSNDFEEKLNIERNEVNNE